MSTYIHGSFKNKKEEYITVEIKSKNGLGDYVIGEDDSFKIYFASDPVEISYSVDELFEHIIKKECKLTLVTGEYLGDLLFSGNEKDTTVKVWKNGDICLFSGYVEPYTYSQGWAYRLEEFTLNCIDELSCLQYQFITDESSWDDMYAKNNILSFKDYISMILPTRTFWDMSKTVNSQSLLDIAGVSLNVFLGDGPDHISTNEEILEEILKYCNLHAIQEGEDIFLFDWDTIGSNITTWYNIYDGSTKSLSATTINVTNDLYMSDDTNISMADVYNQIQIKCKLEDKDEVISSPLSSDDTYSYSDYKHLWFSEFISEGDGSRSLNAFKSVIRQGVESPENIVYTDYDQWYRNDYYFKWNYNPKWTLMYKGKNIRNWLEKDSNDKYINMWRIMKAMRQNKFMPALLSVGKHEKRIDSRNSSRIGSNGAVSGTISMSNYLVISVNGEYTSRGYDDSNTKFVEIENAINEASNFNSATGDCDGLLYFEGDSALYSPTDDETTNYLIFNGSIVLNPVRRQSSIIGNTLNPASSSSETTFGWFYQSTTWGNSDYGAVPVSQNGNGGRYAMQFWGNENQADLEHPMNSELMIYPFTNEEKAQELEYNYSDRGDKTDKFDKIPVLECEMKIGDKYLVETYENGNKQKPLYHWYTYAQCPTEDGYKKTTFSLGFDPDIGDYIIGKEYELANTVDGRYSNEKGTAIPIKKSDALSGKVSFKILGVVNTQWNEITRRHPTMFRHTKYYDNWKIIMSHVSSIWIKDFGVKIISDNKGKELPNQSKDIVYISDEAKGYLKKKDDIDFVINTALTTEELIALGIDNNVSNTNVVNMTTNNPLESIHDVCTGETNRAERLYINQYYNIYSTPKPIINTVLKDNNRYPFLHLYNFNGFGNMIPLSITKNVKDNIIEISCIKK